MANRVAQGKGLDNRKSSRGERKTSALLKHQKLHPELHTREYRVNEVHLIIQTPGPDNRTRRLLDCETDEHGVMRTFAPLDVPYTPEENAASILRHFSLTGKLCMGCSLIE